MEFPQPEPSDNDDVAWAIQTANTMYKRGDHPEAIRWLQRAAEAAEAAGDDMRLLTLARAAAEFAPKKAPPAAAAPPPPQRPPPPQQRPSPQTRPLPTRPLPKQRSQPPPAPHREPPPPRRSPQTAPMGLRASDAQIEEVTSVYVDKARQDPTPQPPPVAAPAADIGSTLPSAQAPVLPPTATPLPKPASATATPTAVHTRAPAHSNPHAHGAHALAPTPVVPIGKDKRVAEYHAVRVAVQPATSPGMYLVRALRSDEKAPAGTREAMLVPTHPEDEFAV